MKLKPPQVSFVMDTEDQILFPSHFKVIKHQKFGVQNNNSRPYLKERTPVACNIKLNLKPLESKGDNTSKVTQSNGDAISKTTDLNPKTSVTKSEPMPQMTDGEKATKTIQVNIDSNAMTPKILHLKPKSTESNITITPKILDLKSSPMLKTANLNESASSLSTPTSDAKASRRRLSVADRLLQTQVATSPEPTQVTTSPEQKPEQNQVATLREKKREQTQVVTSPEQTQVATSPEQTQVATSPQQKPEKNRVASTEQKVEQQNGKISQVNFSKYSSSLTFYSGDATIVRIPDIQMHFWSF